MKRSACLLPQSKEDLLRLPYSVLLLNHAKITEQLKLKNFKNLAHKPQSNIGLLPYRYYLPFQVGDNLDDYYYKMCGGRGRRPSRVGFTLSFT